jgi:hypothetical protein
MPKAMRFGKEESVSRSGGEQQISRIARRRLLVRAIAWLPYALILLPGALSVAYVHEFGVNVVFRDQWSVVSLFRALSVDELTFGDLWAPHNEHRFLFPHIVMLVLGTATEWNNLVEMYLMQACFFVTLVCLLLAFRAEGGPRLILFVPIAFLVFSLRQAQNMLWGFQITFVFAQMFAVLALFLLYRAERGTFGKVALPASLLSGTVASFSAIQGLLVWPAGLLQLIVAPSRGRTKGLLIAVWSLVGALEWFVYFLGYERKVAPPSSELLALPTAGARFFLTLLGSPLFPQRGLVLVSGAILAGLIVASLSLIWRKKKLGEYSFWLSLLAFPLFTSLAITSGRIIRGGEAATAPKYTTFTILAVVCVYAILVKLRGEERTRLTTALLGGASVVILSSIPASYWNGINLGAEIRSTREEAAYVLSTYESQPDERLEVIHRRPETVKRRAPILEELGYNVFSEP